MTTDHDNETGIMRLFTLDVLCMIWIIVAPWLFMLVLMLLGTGLPEHAFTELLKPA